MNRLSLERFLSQVEHLNAEDLRLIRTHLIKSLPTKPLVGDQDTTLVAIGQLEYMANQKAMDLAEDGLSEEQIRAADVARLSKIGGVGAKVAEKWLKERGSPWESATRKARRELAKAAPPIETIEHPEEHERGQEAFERLDPHYKRLAPRKD